MDPERIGPYQLLEKLGSGGMGTVYLGKHTESGRLVALKVLTASLARESGFVERFTREIDAMRKLKNPYIVELFDAGQDGENYYYAMEYVAGETLLSLMRREKRLPWQTAVEYTTQICRALKAAHDAGIIHRDLKPSNLMVTPEGVVKLTDFGVAQVFASNRLTSTGGIIGTAEYMSPEQAQGKRASKQSDLYSLGAVLYAMITGRTPFSGSTAVEVIQKHKFGLFDRPKMYVPDLPSRMDETICRLLEKEPENRFPDALVLLRHLEQVVRLEEFSATGVTLTPELDDAMSAPTVAATGRVPSASPQGPGPATLMQSLVRAELEGPDKGIIAALFNNTYVLIALFVLLIVGGFWWFRSHEPTAEERFSRASALLAKEPGPDWLRARDDLKALLEQDPDAWHERVDPLLQQIELYLLTKSAGGGRGLKRTSTKSEAERLLQLGLHYRQIGDLARAERTLASLHALLDGDESQAKLDELAARALEDVRAQLAGGDDRSSLITGALERAGGKARNGDVAQAREIWNVIIALYGDDPMAAEFVKEAKEGLEKYRDEK
jgi:serine/threonine-protein kinase